MQSASQEFNVYSRFIEPEENFYCNIDPRSGKVVTYEHVNTATSRGMNEYILNTSGYNLSSIDSLSRRRDVPKRKGCSEICKKTFRHLIQWDITFKYMEIMLLGVSVGLFSEEVHSLMATTSTMVVPMAVFAVFLLISFCTMFCMAVKFHVSNIFLIIVNTLAVLLTSISGGVLLGVWLNTPKKIKNVLYWESLSILFQTTLSFASAIVYTMDLAWSLNSLNKPR